MTEEYANTLSPNALKIFKLKYAQYNEQKDRLETWEDAALRVALYAAEAEENDANFGAMAEYFFQVISERSFIPGGRILSNAGTEIKNPFNCFVIPVGDSRKEIYQALKDAAEVFAWGGGVGYNFSKLRETGALVSGTGGVASGPVSFMELFDHTGEVISQSSRRGAQMAIMNVDHPDILKFIKIKDELFGKNKRIFNEIRNYADLELSDSLVEKVLADNQYTHFNISVAVTNMFMDSVHRNVEWDLKSPLNGEVRQTVKARELMEQIADGAWRNGDPGLYFIDQANIDNVAPYLGELSATNPCGEVPLLPYEACCLGSLNLANFVDGEFFDWEYLAHVVLIAVRFLDNIHEIAVTPVDSINEATRKTRRLGLGVMGLADTLAELGLPYDSPEALKFCDDLAKHIGRAGWQASMKLAEERGPFPAYNKDKINWSFLEKFLLEEAPLRNIAVTSIAPTGSIALLADVNSGIEPFFALKYKRNITEGVGNSAKDELIQELPIIERLRDVLEFDDEKLEAVSRTAHDISWKRHIDMQAVWQKYVDNAVSKTVNMPHETTTEDIMQAYMYAWKKKLKGITIYRDGSRMFQILEREE